MPPSFTTPLPPDSPPVAADSVPATPTDSTPSVAIPDSPLPAPRPPERPPGAGSHWGSFVLALFGVLLPAITLGFEIFVRGCANVLFDPIPTVLHAFLVALVPIANVAQLSLRGRVMASTAPPASPRFARYSCRLAGAGAAIAAAYALIFLPFAPFAVIGILFAGIGLLPLAPMLALISSLRLAVTTRRTRPQSVATDRRHYWQGFAVGTALLMAGTAPLLWTHQLARVATAPDSSETRATTAIRWLRILGDRQTLLRLAYGPTGRGANGSILPPVPAEAARELYYRVTGDRFNASAQPDARPARRPGVFPMADWAGAEWDPAVGGNGVAGQVSGLSLVGSRLDATCDPDAGWSYSEWTLEFRNDHGRFEREARAQILLPPGGVVSRLTLWVNGEEREAAFAGRSHVREAYQSVAVVQRRDPVLVTTSGPDRVLMQCFPVPSGGGTMKVRLGVTAPLPLDAPDQVVFAWPRFLERNFAVRPTFRHSVWLETARPPLQAPARLASVPRNDTRSPSAAFRGSWSDPELAEPAHAVLLPRDPDGIPFWATDRRGTEAAHVRQHVVSASLPPPRRLAVVVDGSKDMRPFLPALADVLRHKHASTELAVFLAEDGSRRLPVVAEAPDSVSIPALNYLRARGGHDNLPALGDAWEWAAETPSGTVLWIHAAQPLRLGSADALRQNLERRGPHAPRIIEFAAVPGPDRLTEALADLPQWMATPRHRSVREDLERLLRRLYGEAPTFSRRFERIVGQVAPDDRAGESATGHLVRLWAADTATAHWRARRRAEAVELASRYQLVTPVTGAVVLETQAQFQQTGLTPVDPATVPSVPEPGPMALLLVGALLLAGRHPGAGTMANRKGLYRNTAFLRSRKT